MLYRVFKEKLWEVSFDILCEFFFFKQKTAYDMLRRLVGSEMCIRDRDKPDPLNTLLIGFVLKNQETKG